MQVISSASKTVRGVVKEDPTRKSVRGNVCYCVQRRLLDFSWQVLRVSTVGGNVFYGLLNPGQFSLVWTVWGAGVV